MTQTEVIGFNCAEKDAKYQKHLFSKVGALKKLVNCHFVPIGYHLINDSEALTQILRFHNNWLSEVQTIDIFETLPTEMYLTDENGVSFI